MRDTMKWMTVVGGLTALALVGCMSQQDQSYGSGGAQDFDGVEELKEPLSALATAPTVNDAGVVTITLASAELAVVSKHAVSGFLLVNDVATTIQATAAKRVNITGAAGAETIIIDFANGTFAPGSDAGVGINIVGGGGADVIKYRGLSAAVDTVVVGGTLQAFDIAFNSDVFKDISVTNGVNIAAPVFSLGGGADTFSSAGGNGTVALTGSVTVYGGAGDDVFTSGASASDTFYGGFELDAGVGNDTVTYAARTTVAVTVTVGPPSFAASADDGATGENDDIKNDVETVIGGSLADTFTGHGGNQIFKGGPGDDTFLAGVLSADVNASTGAGSDTFYGEAGTDTVDYSSRTAAVTATMAADGGLADDGEAAITEKDTIISDVENLKCPTGNFNCSVWGSDSANTITLGAGTGVALVDTGAGDDTVVVPASAAPAATSSIGGGAGLDRVDFSSFGATINVRLDGTLAMSSPAPANLTITSSFEHLTCPSATACTVVGNSSANNIIGSSAADTIDAADGDDLVETGGGADTLTCGGGSDIVVGSGYTNTALDCEL